MQKKLTLATAASLISLISYSQIKKGTVVAHFNIGDLQNINLQNKDFQKNNNLSFNPGVGYFIKNNWEVGIGFHFNSFHYRDTLLGGNFQNNKTWGLKAYTNYYFGKGRFKPYLTFQSGWSHTTGRYIYHGGPVSNFNSSRFYVAAGVGLNWNINHRFSLFTEATYSRSSPFNYKGARGLGITAGIRIFFKGKKK